MVSDNGILTRHKNLIESTFVFSLPDPPDPTDCCLIVKEKFFISNGVNLKIYDWTESEVSSHNFDSKILAITKIFDPEYACVIQFSNSIFLQSAENPHDFLRFVYDEKVLQISTHEDYIVIRFANMIKIVQKTDSSNVDLNVNASSGNSLENLFRESSNSIESSFSVVAFSDQVIGYASSSGVVLYNFVVNEIVSTLKYGSLRGKIDILVLNREDMTLVGKLTFNFVQYLE